MQMQVLVGGEGLNLQDANIVINLTPAWNPGVEAQAVARVYRRGQAHDVEYIKLVMKNSVDQYCIHIQDVKLDALEEVRLFLVAH
jgi:SNF2 family DNA or RNA helicase